MKKRIEIFICQIAIVGLFLIPIYSCKKDQTILKKDPVITWANPADISFGTFLSVTQLNATTDATGTFVYTPASGTKLNEGANQDLKVDFTPADASFYNSASKTVKINVTALAATGIIFNPDITYGTMTDQDSNVYKTITITITKSARMAGNLKSTGKTNDLAVSQTWMAENLRTTKFNDGTPIPNITNGIEWSDLTTPAYCWYNNDAAANKDTYGALYNWYAVNSGKLSPVGWHVPTDGQTDNEWAALITYLGGADVAGGKLKEIGFTHWTTPNTGADNSSGFTALPGGMRSVTGDFHFIGIDGAWWGSSHENPAVFTVWWQGMGNSYGGIIRGTDGGRSGYSVRCIRNN